MDIGYKYNYLKDLYIFKTRGTDSTITGEPQLPFYPDIYSNISIFPVVYLVYFEGILMALMS